MSKLVKDMLVREYQDRLEGVDDAAVISLRGVDANSTNEIRSKLEEKGIRVTIVRNALFKRAFEGKGLEALDKVLVGQNALVYGAESVVDVAREVVDLVKDYPNIELKGACLDGLTFEGEDGVKKLSKFPTREEAIADVVTLILSPGRNLAGQLKGPGGRLAGILKAIQDKLENGEEITKQA